MGYPLVKKSTKQLIVKKKILHDHPTKVGFAYI